MTRSNHKTVRSPDTIPQSPRPNPSSPAWAPRLKAVQFLIAGALGRVEQILNDSPATVLDSKSTKLPREIEESQTYFLQKIQHLRDTLQELDDLLHLAPETCDPRELIRAELMVVFVLIDSYRPERVVESGWRPDGDVQNTIRRGIESLGLDVINMRERLK